MHRVFARERLGPAQNDAVHHNEGNEHAQPLGQGGEIDVHFIFPIQFEQLFQL